MMESAPAFPIKPNRSWKTVHNRRFKAGRIDLFCHQRRLRANLEGNRRSRGSGGGVIRLAACEYRPGDARQFVGQSDNGYISWSSGLKPVQPAAEGRGPHVSAGQAQHALHE